MNSQAEFPHFDEKFAFLNQFILDLVEEYNAGKISSWPDLENRVHKFYTKEIMDLMETKAPGWKKMASYSEGITVTHVTCVFLGMFMLPEFQALSTERQQIAKWIVLFHDIDKAHIRGKRDTMHAFNSAVIAANTLPSLGFPIAEKYLELIHSWSEFTRRAFVTTIMRLRQKPDNNKLPEILEGIEQIFGNDSPAALIVKAILLHISLDVDKNYPTPAALKEDEIQRFITPALLPLLKVMMLSDNEGWSLFDPKIRKQQRDDTLKAFERIEALIVRPK